MKVYVNGDLLEKKDAKISVFDHGFLYGDGAFEGIRSYGRLVFMLQEHIDRLYETAHSMLLEIPLSKRKMIDAIVATLEANGLDDAYIRVIVTRGEGDLGLDPKKCTGQGGVVIITDKITLYPAALYEKGMEIITVPTVRNHPEALNPQLKSLNYLNNVLAKIEAGNAGYNEAIMLDSSGYVAECTGDNIFLVKKGILATTDRGRLMGITRECVLTIARAEDIETEERAVTRHEIYNADECFLTGTAAEIIPVVKVDGRTIGGGRPGPVTKKMMQMFKEATRTDGVRY